MIQNNALTNKSKGKLPFKVKLAYGLSGYSSFITWTLFSLYGLYFFTDVVGMSAAFAGMIISLGTIWDAVIDPVIGSLSDNIKSEKGRRRPLIIGVALPFAVISILLFTNFGFSDTVSKIYFVIVILAYYTTQAVLDISSSALGSEMTLDYDERSSLATYKNLFCMIVVIVLSPTLMLTSYFGSKFKNSDFGWSCTVALYMVIALICIFVLWKATKGYERYAEDSGSSKIRFRDIRDIFKNKSTRIVMYIFALAVFGNTMNLSLQVYYYSYYVQMDEAQIASVTMVVGLLSCVGAFGIDLLCKKVSKKAAWIIAVGIEAISMILFIGFFISPGNIALVYVLVILMALGTCAVYQIPWSMIPDCVDVNELISDKRTDGIIFGFIAFFQKVAGAVAVAAVGVALSAIGYVEGASQSEATLNSLKYLYAFVCGGIFLISVFVITRYPLSKKRHDKVLESIRRKKEGGKVDMEQFKDLI